MRYYIYVSNSDLEEVDMFTFEGSKEEMQEVVKARALEKLLSGYARDSFQGFSCGEEVLKGSYPKYLASLSYEGGSYVEVAGVEEQYVTTIGISDKYLQMARAMQDDNYDSEYFIGQYELLD